MMAQGKIAMAIGGPWSIPLIEKANPDIKGKYGFALHPANKGKESGTFFGGWYFATAANSENKEMAWNFMTHACSYDMWMYWAEKYGGPMTPRMDVFRDALQDQVRLSLFRRYLCEQVELIEVICDTVSQFTQKVCVFVHHCGGITTEPCRVSGIEF